jgi:hypothetical protein
MFYWKMQGSVYPVARAWQRFDAKDSTSNYKSCERGYDVYMLKLGKPVNTTKQFVVFDREHNSKYKSVELLTLFLFDICYIVQCTYGTTFRQSHEIYLLLLNCPNMDPYWCY